MPINGTGGLYWQQMIHRYQLLYYLIAILLTFSSCAYSDERDSSEWTDTSVESPQSLSKINLNGRWESKDNPLYSVLEFKGKSTVVVDALFIPFATSYERDEEFIRVRTDQSDLLFEIVDQDSLVGTGFAKGHWNRVK